MTHEQAIYDNLTPEQQAVFDVVVADIKRLGGVEQAADEAMQRLLGARYVPAVPAAIQ